jgi:superfamily II DNA or RNA helicase
MYRGYQKNSVIKFIGEPEGIMRAPAGSGKTVMGLSLIPLLGQPTLWLTHTDRLAKQAKERANQFLPSLGEDDIGLIGARKWKKGNILTIALVQTLIRRPAEAVKMVNDFGLVILDEAHHCPARIFLDVVSCFNPYYLYGLTATPYRRDGLELIMFQALGPETVRITMEDVEKEGGIIIPTIKYRPVTSARDEDNNIQRLLKNVVENEKRTRLIVSDVIREASQGNYCIVISDRKAHCERIFELLSMSLDKVGIATGDYAKKYVDEQVKKFERNEITTLVTTFALLGEGFDVNILNRAFIAMPFRAKNKVEQLIGRIQRTAPGKTDAVVYDYVDVNIPVLNYQFYSKSRDDCRYATYVSLGARVEPYK